MNIEQAVIENLRKLPLEKQQEVLDFTKSLTPKTHLLNPHTSSDINPLKDSIVFENDLISPIDVFWDAEQ